MLKRLFFLVLLFTVTISIVLMAQPGPPESIPAAIARLEQYKKVRLLEVLQLDEETSARFLIRYNKLQEEIRELFEKRRELVDELEKKLSRKASEKEIAQLNTDILQCSERIDDVRAKYMRNLSELLTQEQIAEYLVFEQRFTENIRDIMRELARQRWGGKKPH